MTNEVGMEDMATLYRRYIAGDLLEENAIDLVRHKTFTFDVKYT